VPAGLKARSATFHLGGRSHVDRKAPFTASFVVRGKTDVATASGLLVVGGKRITIPGRLVAHCR
jgi:hypothetical protein